jgi:hypothetical protein
MACCLGIIKSKDTVRLRIYSLQISLSRFPSPTLLGGGLFRGVKWLGGVALLYRLQGSHLRCAGVPFTLSPRTGLTGDVRQRLSGSYRLPKARYAVDRSRSRCS